MENQNPESKPIEQTKKKWSFKAWLSSLRKKEEAPENQNPEKTGEEPNTEKKSNSWIWWIIAIIFAIGIVAAILTYSSKDGKEKAKVEKTTDPTQPGGTQPTQPGGTQPTQPGGTQPTQPGGTQPTQPGGTQPTQPTVQNGLQITFNYSQTFEWSDLDANEQARLKGLETQTSKLTNPINVNLKDILETGKSKITNYEGKGYDMIQLQYVENGNVKTIFTKPGNIAIAL
jgi:hypothetical protein